LSRNHTLYRFSLLFQRIIPAELGTWHEPNRRFVMLLALLLMVNVGGIRVILISIEASQRPVVEIFDDPAQPSRQTIGLKLLFT
jgi:hypothetical protein